MTMKYYLTIFLLLVLGACKEDRTLVLPEPEAQDTQEWVSPTHQNMSGDWMLVRAYHMTFPSFYDTTYAYGSQPVFISQDTLYFDLAFRYDYIEDTPCIPWEPQDTSMKCGLVSWGPNQMKYVSFLSEDSMRLEQNGDNALLLVR